MFPLRSLAVISPHRDCSRRSGSRCVCVCVCVGWRLRHSSSSSRGPELVYLPRPVYLSAVKNYTVILLCFATKECKKWIDMGRMKHNNEPRFAPLSGVWNKNRRARSTSPCSCVRFIYKSRCSPPSSFPAVLSGCCVLCAQSCQSVSVRKMHCSNPAAAVSNKTNRSNVFHTGSKTTNWMTLYRIRKFR